MNYRVWVPLLAIIVAATVPAHGQGNDTSSVELYNHGGMLYRNGDFSGALDVYEELMSLGTADADVFYNASNAAYRAGLFGKAVLYLERAHRLAPSDADITANRAFLAAMKKDIEPQPGNAFTAFFSTWYERFTANGVAKASIFLWIAGMIIAVSALYLTKWRRITAWSIAGSVFVLWIGVTGVFVEKVYSASHTTKAVITAPEVQAYSGPGEGNTHIFTIHEGTTVARDRSQDDWSLIRLNSGAGGWIRANTATDI